MENKEKNFQPRIVKVDNDFNKLQLGILSAVELNLFLTICSFAKEHGTNSVVLPFKNIKKMSNYNSTTNNKRFIKELDEMSDNLAKLNYKSIVSEEKIVKYTLFPTFEIDAKTQELTVQVHDKLAFLLNDFTGNFTRFELEEYVKLKSKYSKILFQLLKQYRKTGTLFIEMEEFRKAMDIPESYRMSEIDKRVLTPALKELENYFVNLTVKKIKDTKHKNAVRQLQFYFEKELGYNHSVNYESPQKAKDDDWFLKAMTEVPVFEK